jgi:hypothetical protein
MKGKRLGYLFGNRKVFFTTMVALDVPMNACRMEKLMDIITFFWKTGGTKS